MGRRILLVLVAAIACLNSVHAQPAPGAKVVDGFERPEYAQEGDFKTSVTRMVARGETTGFVVRPADGCAAVAVSGPGIESTKLYKMVGIDIPVPSYSGGRTGTFYDALFPISAENCRTARYLWLDVGVSASASPGPVKISIDGAEITLDVQPVTMPAVEKLPIRMAFANSMMWWGWYGKYAKVEPRGREFLTLMLEHRLAPYGSWVRKLEAVDGKANIDAYADEGNSFRQHVLDFSRSMIMFPDGAEAAVQNTLADIGAVDRAWFYTWDEPEEKHMPALKALLRQQKASAPGVKRMVTTTYRHDLAGLVDIWTPNANQFCTETWQGSGQRHPCEDDYRGKGDLWLYVSCMSHGCGANRAEKDNHFPPRVPGTSTGTPDLVLDRPAVEAFGYVTLALKYPSVKALLYYNTVEQWRLLEFRVDMWSDPYNFGSNMDGTLFWAGRPGIEGLSTYEPILSVRLKLLRQASYFYDLLSLARERDPAWIKAEVDALMPGTTTWDRTLSRFEALRNRAFEKAR